MSDLTKHARVAVAVHEARFKHNGQRIGQFIYNALYEHFGKEVDLFYVSDEELAEALEKCAP